MTLDWRPLEAGARAVIEIGHAFEWAFLLSEAQELFPEEDLLSRVGNCWHSASGMATTLL